MDITGLASLAVAFVLSSVIGLERELRQRSAGLRTHALVGSEPRCSRWQGGTAPAAAMRASTSHESPPRS